ncbi:MAG: arylsulfatase, partial [Planctomycetota bacterium]
DNGGCAETVEKRGLDRPGSTLGQPGSYVAYGKPWSIVSNVPFRRYKAWVNEGGIATPLIAHWPKGIDPTLNGKWNDTPGHVIDIMATCLDVASSSYPAKHRDESIIPLQGISLQPAFTGKPIERAEPLFWEHEGNRAIRDGDWMLVAKGINGPWQLYHLASDRTEANNLVNKHPAIAKRLADQWEAWAKQANV